MPRLQVEPSIMPATTAARVLDRYLAASPRTKTAAVVIKDVPRGWDWGLVVGSPPPMHLQPMGPGKRHLGRVDLEDEHGRPRFQPRGRIPTDVAIELHQAVEPHRPRIEQAWCEHMAGQAWIEVAVDALAGRLMVQVYGGTERQRMHGFNVDWAKVIGDRPPVQSDLAIDANAGELVLGAREPRPRRVPLRRVVFPSVGARVVDSDQSARVHRVVDRYCADFLPVRA